MRHVAWFGPQMCTAAVPDSNDDTKSLYSDTALAGVEVEHMLALNVRGFGTVQAATYEGDYFERPDSRTFRYLRHYRDHSTALKWLRRMLLRDKISCLALPWDRPIGIPEIAHCWEGPEYQWWQPLPGAHEESHLFWWDWREMIMELDDRSLDRIFTDDQGHERVIAAMFFFCTDGTDTRLQLVNEVRFGATYAYSGADRSKCAMDFLAVYADGSNVLLHPDWNTRDCKAKFDCIEAQRTALAAGRKKAKARQVHGIGEKLRFVTAEGPYPAAGNNVGTPHGQIPPITYENPERTIVGLHGYTEAQIRQQQNNGTVVGERQLRRWVSLLSSISTGNTALAASQAAALAAPPAGKKKGPKAPPVPEQVATKSIGPPAGAPPTVASPPVKAFPKHASPPVKASPKPPVKAPPAAKKVAKWDHTKHSVL